MNFYSLLRSLILPVSQIDTSLPSTGLIYELGSGFGVLAHEIAKSSINREVIGMDIDETKVAVANKTYYLPNLTFLVADAIQFQFKSASGIVMSDFLHHLDYESQEKLLNKLNGRLSKKGVLVIKEIDKSDSIRKLLSRIWDFLLYPEDTIKYRSQSQWQKLLEKLGLKTNISREVPWFPGSTLLFICRKA